MRERQEGLARAFLDRAERRGRVRQGPSQFGTHPPALWLGRRELAHLHRGEVEIRLTRSGIRERREELRSDLRIHLRRPGSDWVRLKLRRAEDVDREIELLRDAIARNG